MPTLRADGNLVDLSSLVLSDVEYRWSHPPRSLVLGFDLDYLVIEIISSLPLELLDSLPLASLESATLGITNDPRRKEHITLLVDRFNAKTTNLPELELWECLSHTPFDEKHSLLSSVLKTHERVTRLTIGFDAIEDLVSCRGKLSTLVVRRIDEDSKFGDLAHLLGEKGPKCLKSLKKLEIDGARILPDKGGKLEGRESLERICRERKIELDVEEEI